MLAGRGRHVDLQVGIGVDRHELLPRRVPADGAEEAVGRGIPDTVGVADGEPPHQTSVEADLDVLGGSHAHDVVVDHPAQPDLHAVVAVERKVVADGQPPAGPERELFAHAVVLIQQPRRRVGGGGEPGTDGGVADREPADPVGGGEIAVEQGGRHREGLGVGAEPFLVHVVRRKQQPALVDLEVEQAPNRVAILGRGQAADGRPARVGVLGRDGVERGLQPAEKLIVDVRGGTRPAGRRHHAEPQLADDLLPHRGVGADVGGIELVEAYRHQSAGFPRTGVAREAIALQQRLGGCGVVRRRRRTLAGRHRRRGQGGQRDHPQGRLPDRSCRPRQHHVSHRFGNRIEDGDLSFDTLCPRPPVATSATVVPAEPDGNQIPATTSSTKSTVSTIFPA